MYNTHTYPGREPASFQSWQALWIFVTYRIGLATLLLLLYLFGSQYLNLGSEPTTLWVICAYLVFAVVCMPFMYMRWPQFELQIVVQIFADIITLTLLLGLGAGVSRDLGVLITISIASGSMLTGGRISLLFASMATLAVFAEQFYNSLVHGFHAHDFLAPGLLGITFFATAVLGFVLSRRIHVSEALANRRANDLAELARLNEHVLQRLQSGILVVDTKRQVRLLNRFAQQLLGVDNSLKQGVTLVELAPALDHALSRWLQDQQQQIAKVSIAQQDLTLIAQFTRLGENTRAPTLIFLDDSLRTVQQAQELKLASLGRLSASIAHEIRNPLGAIDHAAQLLEETALPSEQEARFVQIIRTNSIRMSRIIDNVLSLSRREQVNIAYFDLLAWLKDFIQTLQASLSEPATIKLKVDFERVQVRVDKGQLHQILSNLCENGLRYSKQQLGQLLLNLHVGQHANGHFYIDVIDMGPGLREELVEQIFEPFFTTEHKGTGLGLYIAKELAEANQIKLELVSNVVGGCCFRLTFYG